MKQHWKDGYSKYVITQLEKQQEMLHFIYLIDFYYFSRLYIFQNSPFFFIFSFFILYIYNIIYIILYIIIIYIHCHYNRGAERILIGSTTYIFLYLFLKFSNISTSNSISLWMYKSWYSPMFFIPNSSQNFPRDCNLYQ